MADDINLEELARLLETGSGDNQSSTEGIQMTLKHNKSTHVRITEDKKEAWLYLEKPQKPDVYTKDQLLSYLNEEGVTVGFISSNITAMAKKGVYEREIKVAIMVPCEEGRDGYYEYFFDAEHINRTHPKIREDGSVDYTSMQLLENVKKGQVIARYHGSVSGKNGFLVDGTVINPQPVKELPPLKGTGFNNRLIETEYVAETDGKLEYKNDQIIIRTVHEVAGDVTMITGKVDFDGDIVIKGNVETGVVINSGKTLTIEGTVEAATLTAVGDIILKRGIQGSNKAKVTSTAGSVYADFIEHTAVIAAENIESNTILNSDIRAKGMVTLTGKRGLIIGGYIHGKNGVYAVNAGNNVEVRTILHAGLESSDHERNAELIKKDNLLREKLTDIFGELSTLVKLKNVRELTKNEDKRLKQLVGEKNVYTQALTENTEALEELRAIVEEAAKAEVCIYDKLFRGVIISIDNQNMLIENNTCYMSYRNVSGTIIGSVVIRN